MLQDMVVKMWKIHTLLRLVIMSFYFRYFLVLIQALAFSPMQSCLSPLDVFPSSLVLCDVGRSFQSLC